MTTETTTQNPTITELVEICFSRSVAAGWHTDLATGKPLERNKGEMLMLIVSEVSEAMEGERKGLNDDKLTIDQWQK